MSNSKITHFGVDREKLPDDPVFPNIMKLEELLKGLMFEFVKTKARKIMEYFKEIGIEIEDEGKEYLNLKSIMIQVSVLDFQEMAQLMDVIKKTKTFVLEEEGKVIAMPAKGHSGAGFYPMSTGDMLEYEDISGETKSGIFAGVGYEEDGTIEVKENINSPSVYVSPLKIRRA